LGILQNRIKIYFKKIYLVDKPIKVKIDINGIPPENTKPTNINIKIFA
jgi:hypothetical protein